MLPSWLLLSFLSCCSCQYMIDTAMHADISFNEDNNRFDITNIIKEQNRQFPEKALDYDSRRFNIDVPLVEMLKKSRRKFLHGRRNNYRRLFETTEEFDYTDRLTNNKQDWDMYNKNLESFRRQKPISQKVKPVDKPNFAEELDFRRDDKGDLNLVEENKVKENPEVDLAKKKMQNAVLNLLHGGKEVDKGRRSLNVDPEDEILLHYAVPLDMKVQGYLEIPKEQLLL